MAYYTELTLDHKKIIEYFKQRITKIENININLVWGKEKITGIAIAIMPSFIEKAYEKS